MTILKTESFPLQTENDILQARQTVRKWAIEIGLSLVDQTKIITAASELARNTVIYGGGGTMHMEQLFLNDRNGLRLVFEDQGPGIPDIELALKDGYTSGSGMGLGLGGSRRLCNDFHIHTKPGEGTRITIARWK